MTEQTTEPTLEESQAHALAQLQALLPVPGALIHVTNEVRPDLRIDPSNPRSPVRPDLLEEQPDLLKRCSTFVQEEIVAIDGPDDKGRYTARCASGSWRMGYPLALLLRLTEAGRESGMGRLSAVEQR